MLYVLCLLFCALLGHLLWQRYKTFQILREAGHVGPKANYLFGQYFELKREGAYELFHRWFKEYKSDVVGFYAGSQPTLAIQDIDLAKQILIKDFQKFRNRSENLRLEAVHPYMGAHLLFTLDQRWKDTRNFMTPSFSTVNLREMHARLARCAEEFMSTLASTNGASFDVYPVVRRLTLDNISRGAFSVTSGVQKDGLGSRPRFQEAAENAIDKLGSLWLSVVAQCFKPLGQFLFRQMHALRLTEHAQDAMADYMKLFVKLRESDRKDGDWVDFMQNLVNGGKGDGMDKRRFHKELGFKLDDKEVIGNCLLFFTAAFETTSSALTLLFFELAQKPEIQRRLRMELRESMDEAKLEGLTYDFIMNHTYLDMVVSEGLRLYPTAYGFLGRQANEDFEYKGVRIPKGVDVVISMFSVQRDPRHFPDPLNFDPERFAPQRKGTIPTMAYMPFGEGQRSCIGNRFALMQMKHVLARIMLRYEICLDTAHHIKGEPVELVDRAGVLLQPKHGLHVYLKDT